MAPPGYELQRTRAGQTLCTGRAVDASFLTVPDGGAAADACRLARQVKEFAG
jgi:hypothetical protein